MTQLDFSFLTWDVLVSFVSKGGLITNGRGMSRFLLIFSEPSGTNG